MRIKNLTLNHKSIYFTFFLFKFSVNFAQTTIDSTGLQITNQFIETIFVEGDTFKMGEEDYVHLVSLNSFHIGKYEITQAQWKKIMSYNPSFFKNCENCPVENVSFEEINEFIEKLNNLSKKHYRLPTEAEWEFAARGGKLSNLYTYSGSSEIGAVGWYNGNSSSTTHPVGLKKANELGIFDMTGNVWEWCSDRYEINYHKNCPFFNPKGSETNSNRVNRGGSWNYVSSHCKVTIRSHDSPNYKSNILGFRIVLEQ